VGCDRAPVPTRVGDCGTQAASAMRRDVRTRLAEDFAAADDPREQSGRCSGVDLGDASLYEAASEPRPGVGSNGSQPYPGNQTSTHVCASWSVTVQVPFAYVPVVKPAATRAGMPSSLAIRAIAPAKC